MNIDDTTLLALPQALTEHVLSHLSLGDAAACFAVCSAFRDAAVAALQHRAAWSSNEQGGFSHTKASRLFRFLATHCPQLQQLSCCFGSDLLYGGSLLEGSLSRLVNTCEQLTRLALLNVDVTDKVLVQLGSSCHALQELTLGRTENNAYGNFISDDGLAAVAAGCSSLTRLALFRCYSCSDSGLLAFPRAGRRLSSLVLHNCPQVTPYGLSRFAEGSPGLEVLDVLAADKGGAQSSCLTFESMFVVAANCPQLKVLRVSEELLRVSVLDDAALILLVRGCSQLQELELVQVEIGDPLLKVIATHGRQLQRLRLEQTYVGDVGVAALARACTRLTELRIAGCSPHCWMLPAELMFPGITEDALPSLSQLAPSLRHLELSGLAPAPPSSSRPSSSSSSSGGASTQSSGSSSSSSSVIVHSGSEQQPSHGSQAAQPSSNSSSWASSGSDTWQSASSMVSSSSRSRDSQDAAGEDDTACTRDQAPRAVNTLGASSSKAGRNQHSPSSSVSQLKDSSCCPGGVTPNSGDPLVTELQGLQLAATPLLLPQLAAPLQGLHLDWCKVEAATLQPHLLATLRCCSSLRSLSLIGYQGDIEEVLAQLAAAKAPVTRLVLQHTPVTDEAVDLAVGAFPGLQSLYLSYCRSISDAALQSLMAAKKLQVLDLYNVPLVSDAGMSRLVRCCGGLQKLYIGHHTGALRLSSSTSSTSSSSPRSTSSSEGLDRLEAACSSRKSRVQLLRRNPNTDGGYEARTLRQVLF